MATTKKAIAEAEQAAEIKEATAAPTAEPEAPAVTLDELEGMDMNMFDVEETESAPHPVWRITDDGCADWACQKIAEEKAELDRITSLADSQIEKIQQRVEAAQRRYENGTRFLTGKLAEYFETVPHKTTKTKHSYRLLSGTLVKKIGGRTMKQDDDALLAYLKATATKTATTPPVPLTLQQKFIKLREAVPSITQKAHSDGVKYKFAKIFDVYQLLTPAMNEFGVNFDIVGEQATRHSENGDPIYYSNFTQHTRNGDRIVWVYEADLTIRWTNADNPDETLEVTLHAIGTNDGGPDKAKGSAWTYCLKYYLFEKFGIDQGDDDPDMSDHSSEPPQQSQKQHTGAQNGNRQGNTQPQAQNGQTGRSGAARPLSDAQLSRLYRKGEDAGYSQQSINEWILKKYGQQDPHNLTRAQYDEACAAMDNAKQQGGQDNA